MSCRYRKLAVGAVLLSGGLFLACSGEDGVSPTQRYAVGGTLTGLQGGAVVLQNNGTDVLSLTADGDFQFSTTLPPGSAYNVVVASQPAGQECEVSNGNGTVSQADVTNVTVACQPATYSVGGTVAGLTGAGLVLRNNGGDDLSIATNGGFAFATRLTSGSAYSVEVTTQPSGQTCAVTGGSGTVAGADVTSISVACSENLYTVGGTVSGLGSGSVVLQNNGGDDLTVSGNGAFTFGSPIPDSSGYAVTVLVQPAGQVCSVSAGIGTVGGSDVTDVTVDCADAYTIGGTVSGLGSEPVVLQNNGGDDLTITQDGPFTFSTPVADGSGYDVTVIGQPSVRTCVALTGVGVVAGADVTSIQVTCNADALSNRIAFHSDRDSDFEIYLMNPDGSNVVQLTDNTFDDYWPVISPDGTRIAFWSGRDGNQEIYVMDADGSNQTRVTNHGAADRQPAWSPDGERLAFYRVVNGTTEIYTIKPDGTGEIRLTDNAFDDEEPAWSPDGSLIAFMTNRDGNNEVYVMNAADGSNPQNLSNNPGRDGKPDWSPDGSRLLFDRNNTAVDPNWLGDAEVMCMNSDGSGQVRLTIDTSGFVDTQPRWSASGSRLVFNSDRVADGTNTELYVGRTNNCTGITNLNRVTFSPAKDAAGDWSP